MAMPPSPPPEPVAPSAEAPLDDWLAWIDGVHPEAIELGLDRVRRVAERLDMARPPLVVVTVGGTNGKGSTTRILARLLQAAGLRVATYTSPHLLRVYERLLIDDKPVDLAFGLLVPEATDEQHLKLLATLAQAFDNASIREALRKAGDADDLAEIFGRRILVEA